MSDTERTSDAASDIDTEGTSASGAQAATSDAVGEARSAVAGLTSAAGDAAQRAAGVVSDVATDAASTVKAHAPAAVDLSRSTVESAYTRVRDASDDNLMLGTMFSAGLVAGLFLARVPRLLTFIALVPVLVMGGTLLGRKGGPFASLTGGVDIPPR